jgi:hypothetical protein
MTWAASSTPTGVERHICTGESGIILKPAIIPGSILPSLP